MRLPPHLMNCEDKGSSQTVFTMCGRTACSRNPDGVQCACAYKPKGSKGKDKQKPTKPQWLDTGQTFYPSYNISPQSNTPVLLSSQHSHVTRLLASSEGPATERVIQVMKWGLVPNWYNEEKGKPLPLLNNCRCEGILEKVSFRNAVKQNQRCVVVADGFFEWGQKSGHKQPYFIHFADTSPSPEMLELASETSKDSKDLASGTSEDSKELASGTSKGLVDEQVHIEGFSDVVKGRMLTMAGLFDVCRQPESDKPLYTYTIITLDAHPKFGADIHHRMPAILHDNEAIEKWLDPSIPTSELVPMLHPSPALAWYPVSTVVGNVRNKTSECVEKIDLRKKVTKDQNTLFNWFSTSPKKRSKVAKDDPKDKETEPPDTKKAKLDM